jgi:hypothetical protein
MKKRADFPTPSFTRVLSKGSIVNHPAVFNLDKTNKFPLGESLAVSGNTFAILGQSRFADHFVLTGDRQQQRGAFTVSGGAMPFDAASNRPAGGGG